jgi:glucoamylase
MGLPRRLSFRLGVPVLVAGVAFASLAAAPIHGTVIPLRADGLAIGDDGSAVVVAANSRVGYHGGTSVLSTVPRGAPAWDAAFAEQSWFDSGDPPSGAHAEMAERALRDIRLLTDSTGAAMAAPVTAWRHVWPRDAAFVTAALATTGYHTDAARVLSFLAGVAPEDGIWEARYRSDGSGPVSDGRAPQMDGAGWVPWATWLAVEAAPDPEHAAALVQMMGPAVIASAEAITASIGDDGLPEPSSDYWERPETEVTIGTVGPMSLGLRSAIALAPGLDVDPEPWRQAAVQLDAAIDREFAPHGYPRTVPDGGLDAAVSFLAPPFAPSSETVREAVIATEAALRVPNGGHKPGEVWAKDVNVGWTPETAMLALALAGHGDHAEAGRLLEFLDRHRTGLGALPEKVDASGRPASVAPLGLTGAIVVLALVEMERGVPVVPAVL